MASTIWIIASVLHFWLDDYPSHMSTRDRKKIYGKSYDDVFPFKSADKLESVFFVLLCVNQGVCAVMLLLKICGVLRWW